MKKIIGVFIALSFSLFSMQNKQDILSEFKDSIKNNNSKKMQELQKKGVRVDKECFLLLEENNIVLNDLFFEYPFFIFDDEACDYLFELFVKGIIHHFSLEPRIQFIKQIDDLCSLLALLPDREINISKVRYIFLEKFFKKHCYMRFAGALMEYIHQTGYLPGQNDYEDENYSHAFLLAIFPLFDNDIMKDLYLHDLSHRTEKQKKLLAYVFYNQSEALSLIKDFPEILEERILEIGFNKIDVNSNSYIALVALKLSVLGNYADIVKSIIKFLPLDITVIWKQIWEMCCNGEKLVDNFRSHYYNMIRENGWSANVDAFFLLKNEYDVYLSKELINKLNMESRLVVKNRFVKDLWIKNKIFMYVFYKKKDVFLYMLSFLGYDIAWIHKVVSNVLPVKKKQKEQINAFPVKKWYLHNKEVSFDVAQKFIAYASHV